MQKTSDRHNALVSIVIPCYNQGHYLIDCLQSISKSTHKNIEVIIVNDGSTSPETNSHLTNVLKLFGKTLKITIIHKNNGGLSSARNTGIQAATGDFIQLLDADDLIIAEKLDRQVLLFSVNPSLEVVISDYYFTPENLGYLKEITPSTISEHSFDVLSFLTKWEKSLSIPIHCALFKRDTLKAIQFKSHIKAKEDWVFWTELSHLIGKSRFHYHPERLAIYRVHSASMTKNPANMLLEWVKAQTYLFSKFGGLLEENSLLDEIDKNSRHIYDGYLGKIIHKESHLLTAIKTKLRRYPRLYFQLCRVMDFLKEQRNQLRHLTFKGLAKKYLRKAPLLYSVSSKIYQKILHIKNQ